MCVMCGENEVGTFQSHDQFCGDMCADRYAEALEVDQLCTMCRTHEAVEDGFCSFQCENLFHDQVKTAEESSDQMYEDRYEDHMVQWDDIASQWDDDPSPYAGTYSEE